MTTYNGEGYLEEIEKSWRQGLLQAFNNLPRFDWELNQELDLTMNYGQRQVQGNK